MPYPRRKRWRTWHRWAGIVLSGLAIASGCQTTADMRFDPGLAHYQVTATDVEYPDVERPGDSTPADTPTPRTINDVNDVEFWPLRLEEAIELALQNSRVVRELGVRILASPTTMSTVYDAAIRDMDPRGGTEAALSAFDAQFGTGIIRGKTDRAFNNILLGQGTRDLTSDYTRFQAEVSKTAATGTYFGLRNQTNYDASNSPLNRFPSGYDTVFEAEVRHPLMQGAGIEFNRIAGPNSQPGLYTGVLIARTNADITLADFESSVRDLLYDVERTYWELYFAYRELDARSSATDRTLDVWQTIQRKVQAGSLEPDEEARAREQYYLLESQRINSLSGTMLGGIAERPGGVLATERRLRQLIGLPPTDQRVIRPADEPPGAAVTFEWESSLSEALTRRAELRRQLWVIKRRELELVAARNFLQVRTDLVGEYRWRGFGDDLLGTGPTLNSSAFQDLLSGNHQEYQFGVQMGAAIGNRIGHAATRHAELQLSRERAIYEEQEFRVSHELSDAFADLKRVGALVRTTYNRFVATRQQLSASKRKFDAGAMPLELMLDAELRAVESETLYHRALVDYAESIANVHQAKGTTLEYHNVRLTEGPWSDEAHFSAAKQSRMFRDRKLDSYVIPRHISLGAAMEHELLESVPASPQPLPPDDIPVPPAVRDFPDESLPNRNG